MLQSFFHCGLVSCPMLFPLFVSVTSDTIVILQFFVLLKASNNNLIEMISLLIFYPLCHVALLFLCQCFETSFILISQNKVLMNLLVLFFFIYNFDRF
jgi:hypothetical protein